MKIETYNNLGFALFSFLTVIKKSKTPYSYAKACLILPLVLHDPLVRYLQDGRTNVRGMEDLILSKTKYFLNYNDRYLNYLPLSINTINLALKMGYIEFDEENSIIVGKNIKTIDFNDVKLGNRLKKVNKASENINKILKENVAELYFKLRIEL